MKAYGRSRSRVPYILIHGTMEVVNMFGHFAPGKKPLVCITDKNGWAPELVWTLWGNTNIYKILNSFSTVVVDARLLG
jgi:hypothetical protein